MAESLIAISNHASLLGGGEYSFLELLAKLRDKWNVIALVPQEGELASRLIANNIQTSMMAIPPIRPWFIPGILTSLTSHFRLCLKHRARMIYANGSRAAFYGGIVGRLLRVPVLWHCRIARKDPYWDSILCRLASCIIANSIATSTRFQGFHHKTRIIYNGIDLQWIRDPSVEKAHLIKDDWKVILVVARVSRDKRHDIILSSFEKVAKNDLSAHLVCLGSKDSLDAPWWDHLQEKTLASEAKHRIHWIGHVDDVRPWYKGACALVQGSENESFGRVVVEAMALGLPVIATRAGAIPEIVCDHRDGILVSPGDIGEMAEAMSRMLADNALRNQLGKSGFQRAESFSLADHVERMHGLFENMIEKGSFLDHMPILEDGRPFQKKTSKG